MTRNASNINYIHKNFEKAIKIQRPENFDSPEFNVNFWSNSRITGNFRAVSNSNSYTHGRKSLVKIRPKSPSVNTM